MIRKYSFYETTPGPTFLTFWSLFFNFLSLERNFVPSPSVSVKKMSQTLKPLKSFLNIQSFPTCTLSYLQNSIASFVDGILAPPMTSFSQTYFHGKNLVSFQHCLARILEYAPCTMESIIVSLIYLERLAAYEGPGFVNSVTIHRLFLTSVLVAGKFYDDASYPISVYSKIVGMDQEELKLLETEFLLRIRFSLYFSEEEFAAVFQRLALPRCSNQYYSLLRNDYELLLSSSVKVGAQICDRSEEKSLRNRLGKV